MLRNLILQKRNLNGAIYHLNSSFTWKELLLFSEDFEKKYSFLAGKKTGILFESALLVLPLLVALCDLGGDVVLLPSKSFLDKIDISYCENIIYINKNLEIQFIKREDAATPKESLNTVTIYSSGTTGLPHPHTWSWDKLISKAKISDDLIDRNWISAYPLNTFAGIQSILFSLMGADNVLLLVPANDSLAQALAWKTDIALAMATPSFWRKSLIDDGNYLSNFNIHTISMGGEIVTQDLLNCLKQRYPKSRLVHVYASTEFGTVFSVSDGQAGFPYNLIAKMLSSGVLLNIFDNQLYIAKPDSPQPFPSGDLVVVQNERVFFNGRVKNIINVGGYKVNPISIQQSLQTIDGIEDVYVYSIKSSVTGELVAADIVLKKDIKKDDVQNKVLNYCKANLSKYERPRKIRFVDTIAISQVGKRMRSDI